MGKIRLLVLDVLKPYEPNIIDLSSRLSEMPGIEGVDIITNEMDAKVENVKITLEGSDINFEKIREMIEELGATIHSLDKVSAGSRLIEEAETPQDSTPKWMR